MIRVLSDEEAEALEKEWGIDENELVITFNPGLARARPPEATSDVRPETGGPGGRMPARPARRRSAPRFPRAKSLAWLRELARGWSQCPGTSLFLTRSTPVRELEGAPREALEGVYGRRLLSLDWRSVPGCASSWSVEVFEFGPAARLYAQRRSFEGLCLLAYSDDRSRASSDAAFLRDFFESNGEAYDTFIMGGPPDHAEGSADVPDELLAELLVLGMRSCPWYEPMPDDLEALAWRIIDPKGTKGGAK